MSVSMTVLITIVVYKLALLGIGVWASRRVKDSGDFFLGGQGLGPWVAGLSYAASTSSAWVILGYTGYIFATGLQGLWLVVGVFIGYVSTWLIMGPRLNAETRQRGHITVVDFLCSDAGPVWARRIAFTAAAMILFCFMFYIAAQFKAAGDAFVSAFGLGFMESVLIGALVIVLYCFLGGFWAASVSDAVQGTVMALACIIVPLSAIMAAGGWDEVMGQLRSSVPDGYFKITGPNAGLIATGAILGLVGTGLGALGQPQLLNRIMATRSDRDRKRAAFITMGWGVIIYSGVTVLGLTARALMPEIAQERVIFEVALAYLPAVFAGIVTAAVLSAVMSTVDSLLLAAASAVSHDMKVGNTLLAGRLAMMAIAGIAVILTLSVDDTIFDRVLFAWVALGAAFGPLILTRCLGWRTPGGPALAAIVTGFTIAVVSSFFSGAVAEVMEKWVSWIAGLTLILVFGRRRTTEL